MTFRESSFCKVKFHFSNIRILVWRGLRIIWGRGFVCVNVIVGTKIWCECESAPRHSTKWNYKIEWSIDIVITQKFLSCFSLVLFRFFILVFHLKQKHEEGQRLPHYLQQTDTELAMCKCVCVWEIKKLVKIKWRLYLLSFQRRA